MPFVDTEIKCSQEKGGPRRLADKRMSALVDKSRPVVSSSN